MAKVVVQSYYTSYDGDVEKEHGEAYVVPALKGETPEETIARKHQGAQKHGYTVLKYNSQELETTKYFDDATEHPTADYYRKRYHFRIVD